MDRVPVLGVATTELPAATVGVPYQGQLQASGGDGTPTWELAAGSLPAGLTMSTGGTVTGVPARAGAATFTVRARSGRQVVTGEVRLAVDFAPLVVTTSTLPAAVLGRGYSQLLNALGGDTAMTVQWSLASGALPAGVVLGPAGTLTGTPASLGDFGFRVRAVRGAVSAEQSLQLRVDPPPLLVTTEQLPPARVGVPYVVLLEATGGVSTRTWSLATGRLPQGFTLGADGGLSGTGTAEDSVSFVVEVTSGTQRATRGLTLVVDPTVFPASAVVDMPGDVFTPFVARVRVGGVVTWRFPARAHNVIFAPVPGAPADINIVSSVEVSRTFTRPGEFRYDCTIHPGMAGRVEVR